MEVLILFGVIGIIVLIIYLANANASEKEKKLQEERKVEAQLKSSLWDRTLTEFKDEIEEIKNSTNFQSHIHYRVFEAFYNGKSLEVVTYTESDYRANFTKNYLAGNVATPVVSHKTLTVKNLDMNGGKDPYFIATEKDSYETNKFLFRDPKYSLPLGYDGEEGVEIILLSRLTEDSYPLEDEWRFGLPGTLNMLKESLEESKLVELMYIDERGLKTDSFLVQAIGTTHCDVTTRSKRSRLTLRFKNDGRYAGNPEDDPRRVYISDVLGARATNIYIEPSKVYVPSETLVDSAEIKVESHEPDLDPNLPFTLTFGEFVEDLNRKKIAIKPGKPFVDGKPNSISGYVGVRLNGMKGPYGRNNKEISNHMILKKAFGFTQDITSEIQKANNGGFRSNSSYDRQRARRRSRAPVYSKGSSSFGGYSSRDRLLKLCRAVPAIGKQQTILKSLPKRWRSVYGNNG